MGGLFSLLQDDTTAAERQKQYYEHIAILEAQENQYIQNAVENEEKRKATMQEIYERRKQIKARKMREIDEIAAAYKRHLETRKTLNRQASQLICCILFNYQNDHFIKEDINWESDTKNIITICLNEDSFNLMCKIPQLLPLLWPTGSDDDNAQTYTLNEAAEIDLDEYKIKLSTYIKTTYITKVLKRLIINVCKTNCRSFEFALNESMLTKEDELCKSYLDEVKEVLTDEAFFERTQALLSEFTKDVMYIQSIRMLAAKARKGICEKQIHYLPKFYPRNCVKYEMFEALLMLVNTLCYNYGSIKSNTGESINCDLDGNTYKLNTETNKMEPTSSVEHTYGGMCFELPESFTRNIYKTYYLTDSAWDGKELIKFNNNFGTSPETITGGSNADDWMKLIKPYEKTTALNIDPATQVGTMHYINPTRVYTYQLLNDQEDPTERMQFPKLGAKMSDLFREHILSNLWKALYEQEEFKSFSIYNHKNAGLFNSFDFITCSPTQYEISNQISPTAQFVFKTVLEQSVRWNLIFPIENTCSMSKINNKMTMLGVDKYHIPQNMWCNLGERLELKHSSEVGDTKFDVHSNAGIPEALTADMTIHTGALV